MVGIVVVSHSYALARAAVALAEEMLPGRPVPIVVAAGLDEDTFGTDAVQIRDALLKADQDGDGVVVLMDLGSAVLSAELALELLADDDARERVLLCPAPLVEGLVVAAVTALSGADRATVAAEALAALTAKQTQLAPREPAGPPAAAEFAPEDQVRHGRFVVQAAHGLHARPAARLVRLVQGVAPAQVEFRNLSTGSAWAAGLSLSRLAALGVLTGHEVEVRAAGSQARAAIEAVLALAERNFDDPPNPAAATAGEPEHDAEGPFPASPGIGIGAAQQLAGPDRESGLTTARSAGAAEERPRLTAALDAVQTHLTALRHQVERHTGPAGATIFDAHLALLADPALIADAQTRIDAGQAASHAWAAAVALAAAGFEALHDPYQRARAADVRAVGDQVLDQLLGHPPLDLAETSAQPAGPAVVLIAADLTPAQAATLDPARVAAVVLAFGSPTAHSAILARARGIPAVVAAGPGVLRIADGTPLAVDGGAGEVVIDPPTQLLAEFRDRARTAQHRHRLAQAQAGTPARTQDGVQVLVGANVGSIDDVAAAAAAGADLIGLVRTEFLFLGRARPPDVAEQEAVYRRLAEAFPGRRITLRTLDVGGDKPLDYLPMPAEANPFLGVRGLRLALRRPRLLADQLLAIVRVAHDVPVSVMFPMVSTLAEVISARGFLTEAIRLTGLRPPAGLRVGIMVEVPAAALKAAAFARHVDFLSLGTNDLTQYALAAERGNDALAALGDPLDPGVLQLIAATCRGAQLGPGPAPLVAVCGELAADERATAVLVGLGVRELSVNPRAVPGIKQAIRELSRPAAEALAQQTLRASSADAVRELLAADRPPN